MDARVRLIIDGDESEVDRIKLLVSLTGKGEVIEAILWGPLETYLTTYKPKRFEELEQKLEGGDYFPEDIRELLLQRLGATMSIGANEVTIMYSLATPCFTYVYRKFTDSTEILPDSATRGKLIGRRLEYILLEKRR